MRQKIYAVTAYAFSEDSTETNISVYEIYIDKGGRIAVVNIATKGETDIPVGARLQGGTQLGISTDVGLQLYTPSRSTTQRVDGVETSVFGGGNRGIVALFSRRDAATNCFNAPNLKHWDSRYHIPTINALRKIEMDKDYRISLDGNLHRAIKRNILQLYLATIEKIPGWENQAVAA